MFRCFDCAFRSPKSVGFVWVVRHWVHLNHYWINFFIIFAAEHKPQSFQFRVTSRQFLRNVNIFGTQKPLCTEYHPYRCCDCAYSRTHTDTLVNRISFFFHVLTHFSKIKFLFLNLENTFQSFSYAIRTDVLIVNKTFVLSQSTQRILWSSPALHKTHEIQCLSCNLIKMRLSMVESDAHTNFPCWYQPQS